MSDEDRALERRLAALMAANDDEVAHGDGTAIPDVDELSQRLAALRRPYGAPAQVWMMHGRYHTCHTCPNIDVAGEAIG